MASAEAPAAEPPLVNDRVAPGAPARRAGAPRRRKLPGWLDARRFGLALSIAAGMVASAIGGALAAKSRPAASLEAPAAAPAASAVAAHAPLAASGPAHGASQAEPDHGEGHHAQPPAPAASAVSPAPEPEAAPHSPAVTGSHSEAASAVSMPVAPAASAAEAHAMPATAPVEDLTFGLDVNGDGIPDALERYVRKTIATPATRVAARHYYRVALPLATRAQRGDVLPHAEKQAVFRATECYLLSAADDDVADPPNLNDRATLIGVAAADRMQALAEALTGFDYRLSGNKRQACG